MMEMSLSQMTDQMVMAGFKNFSRHARMSDVKSLMYLGEVAARKLYIEAGYSSMFAFCVEGHHMSKGEAFRRVRVAKVGHKWPLVYDLMNQLFAYVPQGKVLFQELTNSEPA